MPAVRLQQLPAQAEVLLIGVGLLLQPPLLGRLSGWGSACRWPRRQLWAT